MDRPRLGDLGVTAARLPGLLREARGGGGIGRRPDAVAGASLSPRLAWKAVAGADRYTVQLSGDPAFLVGVTSRQTTVFRLELPSLPRRATLSWRVRGRVAGTWGAWSAPRSFRTPAIGVPALSSPASGATVTLPVDLDWTDVPGGATYRVEVCPTSACTTTERDVTVPISVYRLKGSLSAGSHWWRVRAIAADGTAGAWSGTRALKR